MTTAPKADRAERLVAMAVDVEAAARDLRRYQMRLREELWQAALVAAQDAHQELRELRAETSIQLSEGLGELRQLRELRAELSEEARRIQRDAETMARLAERAQQASKAVAADAARVRAACADFPVQIAKEVEEQVRGAFERQERGIMKQLADKLNQHELEQCEAMGEISQHMTTVMKSLVATMVREEVREEMRRVARSTLPACVAAEVALRLRETSTSTSSP